MKKTTKLSKLIAAIILFTMLTGIAYAADIISQAGNLFVDGKIGIGTTQQKTPFSLRKAGAEGDVGITQQQVGGPYTMELTTKDSSDNQATRVLLRGGQDNIDTEFYRNGRGKEQLSMIIKGNSGNVGIGTNDPKAKLDVIGDIISNSKKVCLEDGTNCPSAASAANSVSGVFQPGGNLVLGNGLNKEDRTSIGTWAANGINFYSTCKQNKNGGPCPDGTYDNPADGGVIIKPRTGNLITKGNVGIGTASTADRLTVDGTIAVSGGNKYYINGIKGLNAGGAAVHIPGNVGIGTNDPKAKLDVNGGAFLGVETSISNFGKPLASGFYQGSGADLVGDVPDDSHPWSHLINIRHSNLNNLNQLQIAGSYTENDRLFFRKIAKEPLAPANPQWNEIATRDENTFTGNQEFEGKISTGCELKSCTGDDLTTCACPEGKFIQAGGCKATSEPYLYQESMPISITEWECGGHGSSKEINIICCRQD